MAYKKVAKGRAQKLYYSTTGDEESPTWTEIDIIKDAKYAAAGETSDITMRRHGRFKRETVPLVGITGEFDVRVQEDFSDAALTALRTAHMAGTPIHFAWANGPIDTAGTVYLSVVMEVSEVGEEQPIGDAVGISVKVTAADSDNEPEFVTVAGE